MFITGASSGIGLSLARLVALERPSKLSILARDPQRLEDARSSIRDLTGVDPVVYALDVRDGEKVRRAVEEAGPIDVLVCNHGVFRAGGLDGMELDEVRCIVETNLMGTVNVIKAALPGMRKRGNGPRCIAIMSSQAGQLGVYGYAAYCCTKFGLRGLAEALQQEVIADDIYVSLICPPDTETPGLIEDRMRRPHITSYIAAVSRSMTADEVARKSIDGIKRGLFIVICNAKGLLLSTTTAGLSPQSSLLMALVEVFFGGIARFVGLYHTWRFYSYMAKRHSKKIN